MRNIPLKFRSYFKVKSRKISYAMRGGHRLLKIRLDILRHFRLQ